MAVGRAELKKINSLNLLGAWVGDVPDSSLLSAAREFGDPILLAESLLPLVVHGLYQAEIRSTSHLLAEISALGLDLEAMSDGFVWNYHLHEGYAHLQGLRYEQSLESLALAAEAADRTGNGLQASITALNVGRLYCQRGDLSEAIEILTQLSNRQTARYPFLLMCRAHLSEIFVHQGNVREALGHVTKFLEPGIEHRPMDIAYFTAIRVRMLVELGEVDHAGQILDQVPTSVKSVAPRFHRAMLQMAAGAIALERGQAVRAEALCANALAVIKVTGNSYEELDAQLVYARCLHAVGRRHQAIELLEDKRIESLGPWRRAQIARLRSVWAEELGRWEEVVHFQNLVLELDAESCRRLPDLYGLLTSYRHTDYVEDQRIVLAQASATLRAAQIEKDELLAIVAHDLRSPLTALRLTLEHLGSGQGMSPARHRLAIARRTVDRIRRVTERLERLQAVESETTAVHISDVDVVAAVRYVCQQHDPSARSKGVELIVSQPDHSVTLQTDEDKLIQILENLVSNALKYSSSGGTVRVGVVVKGAGSSGQVRVSVQDTGLGLSAEDQAELFTKYSRLSSRPTGSESSSGIGLYIAKSLATSINASLTGTSPGKGQGSVFVLCAPLWQELPGQVAVSV